MFWMTWCNGNNFLFLMSIPLDLYGMHWCWYFSIAASPVCIGGHCTSVYDHLDKAMCLKFHLAGIISVRLLSCPGVLQSLCGILSRPLRARNSWYFLFGAIAFFFFFFLSRDWDKMTSGPFLGHWRPNDYYIILHSLMLYFLSWLSVGFLMYCSWEGKSLVVYSYCSCSRLTRSKVIRWPFSWKVLQPGLP